MHILADKQGGRNAYEMQLAGAFEGALMSTIRQGRDESAYLLRRGEQTLTVRFAMKGDAKYMPIALASMFSKYVRELFMRLFNRFWQSRVPGLRHTSGYRTDARRFVREIAAFRERVEFDDRQMIRSR